MSTTESYRQLLADVDRLFSQIRSRHSAQMNCAEGCSDCCKARLSLNRLEEAALRAGLEQVPQQTREAMARAAQQPGREYCPALDDHGRCRIYTLRPLICRTIGVPTRHPTAEPVVHPSKLDVCDKNFQQTSLKMLPSEDVLNLGEIHQRLAKLDAAHRAPLGLPGDERTPLATILIGSPRSSR